MGRTKKGTIKLLLSHHPGCYYYRNHVIKIKGLTNYPLCLGCSGFYPAFMLSIFISFFGLLGKEWMLLTLLTFFLLLPTIIRFFKPISSNHKLLRFSIKFFLGTAVGIGIYTIVIAPHILIGFIQFLLGVLLYIAIALNRRANPNPECDPCNYNPSPVCPGFSNFYNHGINLSLNLIEAEKNDRNHPI